MTAAGDAVLAMARSQVGVTEDPPYSSNVPYWDWWGSPAAGAWCAVFVSWCQWHAGAPCCALDGPMGFTYVPNGTAHSYPEGEAAPTLDLQPGDAVLFSWYGWEFQNGVPVINDGSEWTGWTAGDHTGIVASPPDGSGYFWAVEGNTSPTSSGSQDNGGGVWEKQRHTSDVCGWWRPPSYGTLPSTGPDPEPKLPKGDTMLIQSEQSGAVFAVSAEGKRHVGGGEYQAWVASGFPTIAVAEGTVQEIPDVQRTIIRHPNDGATWVVGEGGKRHLGGAEYSWRSPNTAADVWNHPAVDEIPEVSS